LKLRGATTIFSCDGCRKLGRDLYWLR
jgi:hypothetical protein